MYEQREKLKQNKVGTGTNSIARKKSCGKQGFGFVYNRQNTAAQPMQAVLQRVTAGATVIAQINTDLGGSSLYSIPTMKAAYGGPAQDINDFVAGNLDKGLNDMPTHETEKEPTVAVDNGHYYCAQPYVLPVNGNDSREFYGYKNPSKSSKMGNDVMMKGLTNKGAIDTQVGVDKGDPSKNMSDLNVGETTTYLQNHGVFTCVRSGKINLGWGDCIMGHAGTGASGNFNGAGHTRTKALNQAWNKDESNYQGPEDASTSSGSGAGSQRYRTPLFEIGSNTEWL